jgi:hypothetical protein
MEHQERLKSIFEFYLKTMEKNFQIVNTKLKLHLDTKNNLSSYTFIIEVIQEFDGIDFQEMATNLNQTEGKLQEIFSRNIINKNFKISNPESYPNLWVGVLLYKLFASHEQFQMESEWEIYVELND